MTDHQWLLIDHLGSLFGLATFLFGVLVWFAKWGKRIFKRWVREAVATAIRDEIYPIAERVNEMYPWFQVVSKAFGGKSNGKAANA